METPFSLYLSAGFVKAKPAPIFKARLHCSYLPVKDRASFDDMVNDTYTIAGKINERSNYMEESRIKNANGVGGLQLNLQVRRHHRCISF